MPDIFCGDAGVGLTGCGAKKSGCSLLSRNGLRDRGLSGAPLTPKFKLLGEGRLLVGEIARLRKGLLEGRSRIRPGALGLSAVLMMSAVLPSFCSDAGTGGWWSVAKQ